MSSNLTAIILLVASAGVVFGFINPQYQRYTDLGLTNATYDTALEQATQVRTVRDDLLKKNRSFSEDELAKLKKLLPDSVDTVRLTMDLNGIASKHGISIKKIDLSSGQKVLDRNAPVPIGIDQSPYGTLGLSFSLSASYADFTKFLDDLEQSLRIIDISSIQVSPSNTGVYDFTVTARTYWLK